MARWSREVVVRRQRDEQVGGCDLSTSFGRHPPALRDTAIAFVLLALMAFFPLPGGRPRRGFSGAGSASGSGSCPALTWSSQSSSVGSSVSYTHLTLPTS